jgi:hypothetical protein
MNNINNIPFYYLDISSDFYDDSEVDFIALVDKPAIQKNFLKFALTEAPLWRHTFNDEEQIVSGPLMLSDTPIYRFDANGEYYVVFNAATIQKIVQKYFQKGYQANVNLMHDPMQIVDGVTLFESFITSKKRGIQPMVGFEDAPEGSWFGSFKVDNPEVWASIKNGDFKGFSVEGLFKYKRPEEMKAEQIKAQIKNLLDQVKLH